MEVEGKMMTQLTVHTRDGDSGQFGPAYTVCVVEGLAFVRPVRADFDQAAERIEEGLNRSGIGLRLQARAASEARG